MLYLSTRCELAVMPNAPRKGNDRPDWVPGVLFVRSLTETERVKGRVAEACVWLYVGRSPSAHSQHVIERRAQEGWAHQAAAPRS